MGPPQIKNKFFSRSDVDSIGTGKPIDKIKPTPKAKTTKGATKGKGKTKEDYLKDSISEITDMINDNYDVVKPDKLFVEDDYKNGDVEKNDYSANVTNNDVVNKENLNSDFSENSEDSEDSEDSFLPELSNDKFVSKKDKEALAKEDELNLKQQEKLTKQQEREQKQIEKYNRDLAKQREKEEKQREKEEKQMNKKKQEEEDEIFSERGSELYGRDKLEVINRINQYKCCFPENKGIKNLKIKKNATLDELYKYVAECEALVETGTLEVFMMDAIMQSIRMTEYASSRTKFNISGLSDLLKKDPKFISLCKQLFIKYNVFSSCPPEYQLFFIVTTSAYICFEKNREYENKKDILHKPININDFDDSQNEIKNETLNATNNVNEF